MTVAERNRLSEANAKKALAQLQRILESSFFHGSQRCSRFLQYSVENVLSGCSPEDLKERIIGVEVFHREPNYDTAQDSTVRVTANEVRKRLAQYYGKATMDDPIIELAAGSYGVVFRWRSVKASSSLPPGAVPGIGQDERPVPGPQVIEPRDAAQRELPDASTSHLRKRTVSILAILSISIALLIAFAAISYVQRGKPASALQSVWGSVLDSTKPVTICVSQPIAYRPLSKGDTLTGPKDHMVPLPDSFVGVGDAYALANVTAFLGSHGKPWSLLPSRDTSFRDLAAGPVVLIGSFSNPWNKKLADSLRFVFLEGPPNRLVDRAHPEAGWTIQVSPQWTTLEDYAVISKFQSGDTGETIISLAGATNFGTEAAGKFLIDPDMLAAGLRDAPRDWRNKNFQIVLHVKVAGSAPEKPTVVAKYFW